MRAHTGWTGAGIMAGAMLISAMIVGCREDAPDTTPPSCEGGLDCGGVSCCATLLVPGGEFPMGRGEDADQYPGESDEAPEHPATIPSFSLDTFEVTVGRFRSFVNAFEGPPPMGAGAHPSALSPAGRQGGWELSWGPALGSRTALVSALKSCPTDATWTDLAGDNEQLPINCVSWYEAFAFCAWDGGYLPTEAEWEYAAAGGADNRRFPWGADISDHSVAVFNCQATQCDFASIAPVGSKPAGKGKWGHLDLAGSMWEWTLDGYDAGWYEGPGATCAPCANTESTQPRVVRGGAWSYPASFLRAAQRYFDLPSDHSSYVGFRCARAP